MVSINLIIKQGRQVPKESSAPTHFQASFPPSSRKMKDHDGLILQLETLPHLPCPVCTKLTLSCRYNSGSCGPPQRGYSQLQAQTGVWHKRCYFTTEVPQARRCFLKSDVKGRSCTWDWHMASDITSWLDHLGQLSEPLWAHFPQL